MPLEHDARCGEFVAVDAAPRHLIALLHTLGRRTDGMIVELRGAGGARLGHLHLRDGIVLDAVSGEVRGLHAVELLIDQRPTAFIAYRAPAPPEGSPLGPLTELIPPLFRRKRDGAG